MLSLDRRKTENINRIHNMMTAYEVKDLSSMHPNKKLRTLNQFRNQLMSHDLGLYIGKFGEKTTIA